MAVILATAGILLLAGPASVKAPRREVRDIHGAHLPAPRPRQGTCHRDQLPAIQPADFSKAPSSSASSRASRKPPSPIANEAKNGLRNAPATIAMPRSSESDSATAQIFINADSNRFLDFDRASKAVGYAVFGKAGKGSEGATMFAPSQTRFGGALRTCPRRP
ncbi:MAG: peptidylprolyl isomerase [Desulfovibrio sp.]|nr:peptidylprolyl isomerase [Desulfovibrio sp.]